MATTKVNVSKISDFPKVTPAGTDYILVEKDGQGGSITLSQIPVSKPVEDKITGEVNKLNSQINDLAFLPEGSTAADAELISIRTPADGFTVPAGTNAGGAVRAQVTQLDDKISSLKGDLVNKKQSLETIGFIEKSGFDNLFDKEKITVGYYLEMSNGTLVESANKFTSDYIPVKKGHTYSYRNAISIYGESTAKYICYFDMNKNFKKFAVATVTDKADYVVNTITPDDNYYIRVSHVLSLVDSFSVLECDANVYVLAPVERKYRLCDELKENIVSTENSLHGKQAIFFGDSICAAETSGTDSPYYLWGWAGRIGTKNNMTWKNYGWSGATVATDTTASVWIKSWFNHKKSEYPNADYIIFEGGTNDADLLGDAGLGTYEPRNYSGTYDTTTFTGALEQLFYDAITSYPNGKIGYIVAHKMGKTDVLVERRRVYFDRAVEICKKWGIPYIDLWNGCKLNWNLSCYYDSTKTEQGNRDANNAYVDGQHLSDVGYDIITPLIEEWMKTL